MLIKINKKELNSLLGEVVVPLKTFVGLDWAQDGMKLSTSRTLFLGSLKVKISWPTELAKQNTLKNKELLWKAISYLLAQVDERYVKAVMEKEKQKTTAAPAPANA